MAKHYDVIIGLTVEDFIDEVNSYLEKGYYLQGGIAVFDDGKMAQAVVEGDV